jgi:hypothetical protein
MVPDRNRLDLEWPPERVRRLLPPALRSGEDAENEQAPTDSSERISADALRERVSDADLRDRVATANLRQRVSTGDIRTRVSAAAPDKQVSLADIGDRMPAAGIGERVSPTALRSRVTDTAIRERLPAPAIDRDLSAPPVELPDSDDIVDRDRIEAHLYDTQTTTPEYFVGVIPEDHDTVSERLAESAFGVSRITYPKTLADEDIDYLASSIWVYRSWPLSHFQLHVPLFEVTDDDEPVVYVFYHHEYNWLRHPARHLDAEYLNPEWGCDEIIDLIEAADLPLKTCADLDGEYDRAAEYCATCGDNT